MTQKAILFDLDGTLTDSAEGILNCVAPALEHFGLPVYDRETMIVFVGPPLFETFPKFGVPADGVQTAIDIFRARYTTVGKFENTPFPGIREMLAALRDQGHTLYIATSKPEQQAREILEHFDLAQYFDIIAGAATDKSRATKEEVIAYLKEHNRGYTVFEGHGSIDKMNMIFVVLPRRETKSALKDIRSICDNHVFVSVSEVSKYAGGYGLVK